MSKAIITARFNSTCAETGRPIKKGEPMVYDYQLKKCYARGSATEIAFVTGHKPTDIDQGGYMLDAMEREAEDRFRDQF